jgi:hypothetical protein
MFDFSGVLIGLTAGYSTYLLTETYYDYYWDYYYSEESTVIIVPVLIHASVMPLRFFLPNLAFQFYTGLSFGRYLRAKDTDDEGENYGTYGPNFGLVFYIGEWFNVSLDGRYMLVAHDDDDINLGYTNILLSIRFRIPFIKREF